jgi:hypothetical protein
LDGYAGTLPPTLSPFLLPGSGVMGLLYGSGQDFPFWFLFWFSFWFWFWFLRWACGGAAKGKNFRMKATYIHGHV